MRVLCGFYLCIMWVSFGFYLASSLGFIWFLCGFYVGFYLFSICGFYVCSMFEFCVGVMLVLIWVVFG